MRLYKAKNNRNLFLENSFLAIGYIFNEYSKYYRNVNKFIVRKDVYHIKNKYKINNKYHL